MQNNYKPIGDYIQPIKVKNSDLSAKELLGINVDKFFMPSVANIVGTDLSNYKVVNKNQFACNRMHVGRDYRIPIALSDREEPFMVSPAYDVFEIIDTSILHPDYLMMWFSRKEYDRNAWFYTDADVRGGLAWETFCNMKFPLPSPEKQREIVAEYTTVNNRIELNNKLIQKLEETAQTIYKQWFVDFEFPDENGNPYKSSGGAMAYNEELDKEIPEGWEVKTVREFSIDMKSGGTPNRSEPEFWNSNDIPWLKTGELRNSVIIDSEEFISEKGLTGSSAKILPVNSVLIAMYGEGNTKGQVGYLRVPSATNQACCAMICESEVKSSFLYYHLRINRDNIVSIANGGAQPNLSKNNIEEIVIIEPTKEVLAKHPFVEMLNLKEKYTIELKQLGKLSDVLLSKLSTIEN